MNNQENNKIWYIIGGVLLGIIIVLLLNPVIGYRSRGMMSWGNDRGINSSISNGNSIDKHFIEQMIPHHEGAIDMAKLARTKATHPEVKVLAEAIIKAQATEITDMTSWYKDWFGKRVSSGGSSMMGGGMMSGSGMHMGGQEDMTTLEAATDFDKAFLEQMIPHHQLAIMMAQMLKSGTTRPEMIQLANNIIESQSKEIGQMQTWYKTWYK